MWQKSVVTYVTFLVCYICNACVIYVTTPHIYQNYLPFLAQLFLAGIPNIGFCCMRNKTIRPRKLQIWMSVRYVTICHVTYKFTYLPDIILCASILNVVFCYVSNNVEQPSVKMNVSYICNKTKKSHPSHLCYICNT